MNISETWVFLGSIVHLEEKKTTLTRLPFDLNSGNLDSDDLRFILNILNVIYYSQERM